jgi:hypothetical protein
MFMVSQGRRWQGRGPKEATRAFEAENASGDPDRRERGMRCRSGQ